jgi:hypothetical protein
MLKHSLVDYDELDCYHRGRLYYHSYLQGESTELRECQKRCKLVRQERLHGETAVLEYECP